MSTTTTTSTLSPPTMHSVRHISSNPTIAVSSPTKRHQVAPISPQRQNTAGSRSPSSIPSSPTSIHSSSSAIFERDIEAPVSLFPQHTHSSLLVNPHSRRTHTEDQSVPSVLTSAVEALEDHAAITIISPAVQPVAIRSGVASPAWGSRSPSPTTSVRSKAIPTSSPQSYTSSLPMPRMSPPQLAPLPAPFESSSVSPPTSTFLGSHPSPTGTLGSPTGAVASPFAASPTTPSKSQNRLSFISYTDLLSSTPLSATPFSAIVSPATTEPPPHLPEVLQVVEEVCALGMGSSSASVHSAKNGHAVPPVSASHSNTLHPSAHVTSSLPRDIGGEWEREGLGKGLEERLENLLAIEKQEKARVEACEREERGRIASPAVSST